MKDREKPVTDLPDFVRKSRPESAGKFTDSLADFNQVENCDQDNAYDKSYPKSTVSLARIFLGAIWAILVFCSIAALIWWTWAASGKPLGPTWPSGIQVPATQVALSCPSPLPARPSAATSTAQAVGAQEKIQVTGSTSFSVLARGSLTPKSARYELLDQNKQSVNLRPRSAALTGELSQPRAGFLYAEPVKEQSGALQTPLAGAYMEQSVSGGDYRGFAASACLRPSGELWLVGGDTRLGSSTVLQLLNPAGNPVTASFQIWGTEGQLPSGRENFTVPARGSVEFPLEAQVTEEQRLVVRVTAKGSGLSAVLRVHELVGLVPAGVSLVTASAPPSKTQVIPALSLTEAGGHIRLFNPGTDDLSAQLTLLGQNGQSLPGFKKLTIRGQSVIDVDLSGVPKGSYGVIVKASSPVVSGAVVYREGKASKLDPNQTMRDQGWFPSVAEGGGLAFGPAAVKRELIVTNPSNTEAKANIGKETINIAPVSTVNIELKEEQNLFVHLPGLYANQVITTELGDGTGISSLSLIPDYSSQDKLYIHVAN